MDLQLYFSVQAVGFGLSSNRNSGSTNVTTCLSYDWSLSVKPPWGGVCTLTFSLKPWSGATGRREERGTRGPQTGRERGGWLRAVMWLSAALCFLSHRACVRHLCSGSPFLSSYHYHSFDYCCRFITSEGTVRQEGTFSFFADADKRLQRRTVTHEQPCRRVVLGTRFRVSKWCWTGLKTVIYVSCTEIK